MYTPYFRGKQNELRAIEATAPLFVPSGIIPIVEPTKYNSKHLDSYRSIVRQKIPLVFVVNPQKGGKNSLKADPPALVALATEMGKGDSIRLGFIISRSTKLEQIRKFLSDNKTKRVVLIHYHNFKALSDLLGLVKRYKNIEFHVFVEAKTEEVYRNNFREWARVLIEDGYSRDGAKTLREQAPEHDFSDLFRTYKLKGFQGYGDFSIVGDRYSSGGGPHISAYGIHYTYLLPSREGLGICHFNSDTLLAGKVEVKWLEAIRKMQARFTPTMPLIITDSTNRYFEQMASESFPGINDAKVQNLSHHMELMVLLRQVTP